MADVIHPTQNLTALPLNIEEDRLDDPNAAPQPLSVYTVRIPRSAR